MAEQIEHEVLVCDNGTGFVKCGFAGEVKQISSHSKQSTHSRHIFSSPPSFSLWRIPPLLFYYYFVATNIVLH